MLVNHPTGLYQLYGSRSSQEYWLPSDDGAQQNRFPVEDDEDEEEEDSDDVTTAFEEAEDEEDDDDPHSGFL